MTQIQLRVNSLFSSISYGLQKTLIDCGDEWEGFKGVSAVLLTHAHFDHIYGLNKLFTVSPEAKVYTNSAGKEMLLNARKNLSFYHESPFMYEYPDQIVVVEDGEEVEIGNGLSARAVFTPGHNASCITWVVGDCLFTGDAYIPGIKTVTNLPGSNKQQAAESLKLIEKLSKDRTIYPGHKV